MKIIAFAGSNSTQSINKKLVEHTATFFKNEEVEVLDLNKYEMPLYSIDREKSSGIPTLAIDFIEKIASADALIISLAEHNRSYTTAFKNLFDWMSRATKKPFQDKKTLLLSTSPGGYGGGNVMNTAMQFLPEFGCQIVANFKLPKFQENFNSESGIINEELNVEFLKAINAFKESIM